MVDTKKAHHVETEFCASCVRNEACRKSHWSTVLCDICTSVVCDYRKSTCNVCGKTICPDCKAFITKSVCFGCNGPRNDNDPFL